MPETDIYLNISTFSSIPRELHQAKTHRNPDSALLGEADVLVSLLVSVPHYWHSRPSGASSSANLHLKLGCK